MKRIQLFEFEDQSWFPDWIRVSITKLIVVFNKALGVDVVVANLLSDIIGKTGNHHIVDLGSGSGGTMPLVFDTLKEHHPDVHLTLTDLYPSKDAIRLYNETDGIDYLPQPIDATQLTDAPQGIKTMVNSFHHMNPDQARQVLQAMVDSRSPALIYEVAVNDKPTFIWWLFLPLGLLIVFITALIFTPFTKPLSLKQIFFTYLIPIIPICYAWDGQASFPRIYALEDLDELLKSVNSKNYKWETGVAKKENGSKVGTFIIGIPIKES